MSARERILTIRLLEKIRRDPAYAEALGIMAVQKPFCPQSNSDSPSAEVLR